MNKLESRVARLEKLLSNSNIKNESTFDEVENMFNKLAGIKQQFDNFCNDFDPIIYEYSTPEDVFRKTALSTKADNVKQAIAEFSAALSKIKTRLEID